MRCNCGKPKCKGQCGCKSPAVLQVNNPAEYITFHKVKIPASMGDSTTNPPRNGAYRNALVWYEADNTSWMYSTDGIPTEITGPRGPQGIQGPAGTIEIGTTTTGEAGTDAEVENVGTPESAVLNFTIPKGDKGEQGETGPQGYMNEQDVRDIVGTIVPEGFFDDEATVSDCGTEFELENLVGGSPESLRLNGDTFQQSYTGKNLFDGTWRSGQYNSTGEWQADAFDGDRATTDLIPVTGGNYAISLNSDTLYTSFININYFDESENWLGNRSTLGMATFLNTDRTKTFTLPDTAYYLAVSIRPYADYTGNKAIQNAPSQMLQVERASAVSSYEPFVGGQASPNPDYPQPIQTVTGTQTITINGTDYPIDLGNIELCKLGTYQDYIWKDGDDWKVHKATGEFVFTAETTPNTGRSKNGNIGFAIDSSNNPLQNKHIPLIGACSHFGTENTTTTWTGINRTGVNTSGALWFQTGDSDNSDTRTVAQFFEWLAGSNATYNYALATPTDTIITDSVLTAQLEAIRLQSGTNTISVTSEGLVGSICLSGYVSNWGGTIGSIEQNLSERVYSVDTTVEMSLREFSIGEQVHTLGYWEKGDGGGGHYYIVDAAGETPDGGSVIALPNGLVAKLDVKNDVVNVKQFGAKGDGVTNDSAAIQNALAYNGNNKSIVKFVKGETYRVDNNFYIYSNTTVDLNGCIVKDVDGGPFNTSYNRVQFMNNLDSMTVAGYGALKNFVVKNGTFDGNAGGVAFPLFHAQNCTFENINFNNCFVSTHVFDLAGCNNIAIKNCNFIGNLLTTAANNFREVIQPDYATYSAAPYWGDDPSFGFDAIPTDGLTVDGCVFKKNYGDTYYLNGVGTHSANANPHNNIVVRNCEFYDCQYSCIRLLKANNIVVENNTFYNIRTDRVEDNFAINISNEGSSGIMALHGVAIRGNKYISTQSTTDQIFIKVFGRDSYLTTDVVIENNIYNGTSVSEADYVGNDCAQAQNIDGMVFRNNIINRAKAVLFIGGKPMTNLKFVNNTLNGCLRGVRANSDTYIDPGNFIYANNYWTNPIAAIDTSGTRIELGLEEDLAISTVDPTNTNLPLAVTKGIDLYIGTNQDACIPDYIRRVRISGTIAVQTTSGGTLNTTRSFIWDRKASAVSEEEYCYYNADTNGETISFSIGDMISDNTNLSWTYFGSSSDRLWRDGRKVFTLRVNTTGDVTVLKDGTKIIIEAF